jgi:hypothetical protein
MKLNVGVSRKVGLPDYGSVGASCNLELELESGLLERDLQAFHDQIRGAYMVAHQAVHDELSRLHALGTGSQDRAQNGGRPKPQRNGYDRSKGTFDGRRSSGERPRAVKPATPNQIKAILAISRKQETDLAELLRHDYEAERPEELTIRQASELIDLLKSHSVA